jgi:hypothetical protein
MEIGEEAPASAQAGSRRLRHGLYIAAGVLAVLAVVEVWLSNPSDPNRSGVIPGRTDYMGVKSSTRIDSWFDSGCGAPGWLGALAFFSVLLFFASWVLLPVGGVREHRRHDGTGVALIVFAVVAIIFSCTTVWFWGNIDSLFSCG